MSPAGPPQPSDVEIVPALTDADVAAAHDLVAAATEHDGVAPLHEPAMLALTTEPLGSVRHLLGRDPTGLVAYAQLDEGAPASVRLDCVVAPRARRRGWGRAVIAAARQVAARGPFELWSHGDQPGAAAMAGALGFRRVRELWLMRRDLAEPLPAESAPDTVEIRTFRPGFDEDAWLKLNARAFADHPEQGRMTRDDLAKRLAQPWFDPNGFFVAERDGQLVGFHWTKVHPSNPPVGEVYVVGIDPDAQGLGLGRTLTLVGLHHLADRGLATVILYVESDNAPAIAVYTRLGFVHEDTDVMYRG